MTKRTSHALILLVLALFCVLGVARHLHMYGEDLASSYVGCRLLAAGEGAHLYSHSPTLFSSVADPVWYDMALRTGFTALKYLHPYVQTPLWAWSLEPACTHMNFRAFCDGFIVILTLCTSALIWLVARYWAPSLFHPGWIALVFALLYVSEPFKYSIFLAQTHIVFVLLSIVALLLEERDESVWAGVALALAALVKITPGLLLIYWLVTRRWKAAASFVIAFAVLTGLGVLAVGPQLTRLYARSLSENGNVLLVAFNNQSLAGWWMGHQYPRAAVMDWSIHSLPPVLKWISLVASVTGAVVGGWLDRSRERRLGRPPYGAIFALVGATAFAPIAWSHYYILLLVPAMLLLHRYRQDGKPIWLAVLGVVLALNLYPVSYGDVHLYFKSFSIVRSQFYAGLVMMAALVYVSLLSARSATSRVAAKSDAVSA